MKYVYTDDVKRGVEFLDERYPGWWRKDFSNLDASSRYNCALGIASQDNYITAVIDELFGPGNIEIGHYLAALEWCSENGFHIRTQDTSYGAWGQLGKAWRGFIATRKREAMGLGKRAELVARAGHAGLKVLSKNTKAEIASNLESLTDDEVLALEL